MQHYYDSRGAARVYQMSLAGGVWKLWREALPAELTPIGDQARRLHSHADTLEWLAFRLILLDCEFEVHQPPELAGYLRMLGARLTRAAGPEPQPPD